MKRDEWLESLIKRGWSGADISKARFAWNAAEREIRKDCARICDEYAEYHASTEPHDDGKAEAWMILQCAAKIRESIK